MSRRVATADNIARMNADGLLGRGGKVHVGDDVMALAFSGRPDRTPLAAKRARQAGPRLTWSPDLTQVRQFRSYQEQSRRHAGRSTAQNRRQWRQYGLAILCVAVCTPHHQQARWALRHTDPAYPTPEQRQWALWWRDNMEGTAERREARRLARSMDMDPDAMIRHATEVWARLLDSSDQSTETDSSDSSDSSDQSTETD